MREGIELQLINRGVPIHHGSLVGSGISGFRTYGLKAFMRAYRADPAGFLTRFFSQFGPVAMGGGGGAAVSAALKGRKRTAALLEKLTDNVQWKRELRQNAAASDAASAAPPRAERRAGRALDVPWRRLRRRLRRAPRAERRCGRALGVFWRRLRRRLCAITYACNPRKRPCIACRLWKGDQARLRRHAHPSVRALREHAQLGLLEETRRP